MEVIQENGQDDVISLMPRPPRTALDLLQDQAHTRHLSFGCPVLDETFGGGLPGHGVIEISGMAGSGKTQLMLQLLIQQLKESENAWRRSHQAPPFIAGRSFLLSTEGALPVKRLQDMAAAACPNDSGFAQRVLESVTITEARNVEEQLYMLTSQLPNYLAAEEHRGIRLCIIDSMSAHFRGEFGSSKGDNLERAKMIFAMAKQMKKLSHDFQIPFIVTNQVTADFSSSSSSAMPFSSSSAAVQPALGISWSSCVHTRYMLTRRSSGRTSINLSTTTTSAVAGANSQQQQQQQTSSSFIRQIRLLLSPSQPSGLSCRFVVETAGVRGLRHLGGGGWQDDEEDDEEEEERNHREQQLYHRQQQQQQGLGGGGEGGGGGGGQPE